MKHSRPLSHRNSCIYLFAEMKRILSRTIIQQQQSYTIIPLHHKIQFTQLPRTFPQPTSCTKSGLSRSRATNLPLENQRLFFITISTGGEKSSAKPEIPHSMQNPAHLIFHDATSAFFSRAGALAERNESRAKE